MSTTPPANRHVKSWSISGDSLRLQIGLRGGNYIVIDDDIEEECVPHLADQPGDVADRPYVCRLTKKDTSERHEDMKMAMEGEGNHEEYIQVVLIPLAHEHNPDKFVNQAEGSSSSSITAENQRLDNALFDRSENINNDESGLTEPTSICIEDAIGNIQETRMQNFNIVDQCSADEKAQLLSDLNIHYDPTKSSLSDATRKNEDPEDGDEGLNLDEVEVPPRNVVTTALNDFVSAEATHGRPTGVVAETGATGFCCNTEEFSLGSVEDAQLGWHGTIWRWVWDSKIEFNVNSRSFPLSVDVSYVKKSLMKAACEWNRRIAAVQFVPVADAVPAVFQLTYRHADDGRGTLARAFIPRYPDTLEMLQKLFVYPLVFKKKHYPHMTHIFCHELGHILDRSAA
ncbi:hypothetical protein MGN70_013630 [Eutypa lata]|nr:hypothetical protein MGN70_013630 [Eutypa lata]